MYSDAGWPINGNCSPYSAFYFDCCRATLGYMGIYKRVSRHVRFEPEIEDRVQEIIKTPGSKQTFSDFVRNAVEVAVLKGNKTVDPK